MSTEPVTHLASGVPIARADGIVPPLGALEILAAGTDPFVFLDADFRVRYANPAAERHLGRRADSLYGQRPWEGWPGILGGLAEPHCRRAVAEQAAVRFVVPAEREGGVQLEGNAYPAAGGLALFLRDVTGARVALEEARQRATRLWDESLELAQRTAELTRANASLAYARREAEQSAERLAAAMDAVGAVVSWYDAQWRWRFVNEAGRLMLAGLGHPGDVVGLPLWETLPQLAGTPFEQALRGAASERRVVELEAWFPPTGQWLALRAVPMADGSLLTVARDVTAARREHDALRESEARHRTLVDAATQMVWRTDASGQVADMPFWRELTGQTEEEVRGSGWMEAVHPADRAAVAAAFGEAVASGAKYEAQYRIRRRDGSYGWYRARGAAVRDEEGRIREWIGLFNEVDRMVRRDEGMRFLVEASAALSATLDERSALDTLAQLAIDHIADGAMITLARDGRFEHVATRSRDGDVTATLAAETERLFPLPADAPWGFPRAIRTGEAALVPADVFETEILPTIARDPEHLERMRRLRMYSAMVVPLVARGGILGAMTLVLSGPERRRAFDAGDLALATELARRAALAVENARLFAAERIARAEAERAAELTRRMQEITAAFARAVTVEQVASTTLSLALDALSGRTGAVYLMSEAGDGLDLIGHAGVPDELLRPFRYLPLAAPMPVSEAARLGEMVLLDDVADGRYPESEAVMRAIGASAWAMVPLAHGGRRLGVIAVGFAEPRAFGPRDEALLDALGRHCAQAIERARLLDAARVARDEAERANQAKSDLLAKVSHETRQPVHASVGWVDTMEMELQGPITPAQREALRRVKQNQLRLLTVLNDLLDMSRIEAGRLELHLRDVPVAEVVDAVEAAVAPQMRDRGLRYDFVRPAPTVQVRADVDQLIGILTNLLSNAAKFTPPGGEVTVTCEPGETMVTLSVRDTGIGIPAELADRVFEPFFQVDSGFTRTTVGTGLGLAISREAARAMGGELVVESEVGRGSVFSVRLPSA